MPGRKTDISLRTQALVLLEEGIPVSRIMEITSYSKFSIYHIKQITYEQGYNPAVNRAFKNEFFVDAPALNGQK